MTDFIQVSTTTNTRSNADKIAKLLLERRLAACVQILGPINSNYWWDRKLEGAKEWLCLIKAPSKNYRRIESAIKKNHPYKVPEILAFPILAGNLEYLRWIGRETRLKR